MTSTGKQGRNPFRGGHYRGWRGSLLVACLLTASGCSHKAAQPSQSSQPYQPAQTAQSPTAVPETAAPAASGAGANHAVQAHMHNVFIHLTDSVAIQMDTLSGELVPVGTNVMPVFDDSRSYVLSVKFARVRVSPEALANVMNSYAFAKPDAPLKGLSITIEGNQLRVKGRLHSKGDIPFETLGTLSPTKDGKVRIHTQKVKAFRIPIKGIMSIFGMDLANMINTSKVPGIETENDDLIMDISKLMPPPELQGAVTAVRVEPTEIVFTFGTEDHAPPLEKGNYMTFRGGQLQFGKLIMTDTDLTVLGLEPADHLDWSQTEYKEQLAAGYAKITPAFGLRAYVKDFNKLAHAPKK